jgi:hypothetical protein
MGRRRSSQKASYRCPDNYRWTLSCELRFPCSVQRSVACRQLLRDQAVTNARQLADLLSSAEVPVAVPSA